MLQPGRRVLRSCRHLDALPDEDGEVSAEEHVEHGAADVRDLHGEGLAHHHVERAAHLLVQHVLKAASLTEAELWDGIRMLLL